MRNAIRTVLRFFLLSLGLCVMYSGLHIVAFLGGFSVETLGIWSLGLSLICLASGQFLSGHRHLFVTFVDNRRVLYFHALASLCLTLGCSLLTYLFFGLNLHTLFGFLGILLGGTGVYFLATFDYRKYVRKQFCMEYMDAADTWVNMNGTNR